MVEGLALIGRSELVLRMGNCVVSAGFEKGFADEQAGSASGCSSECSDWGSCGEMESGWPFCKEAGPFSGCSGANDWHCLGNVDYLVEYFGSDAVVWISQSFECKCVYSALAPIVGASESAGGDDGGSKVVGYSDAFFGTSVEGDESGFESVANVGPGVYSAVVYWWSFGGDGRVFGQVLVVTLGIGDGLG